MEEKINELHEVSTCNVSEDFIKEMINTSLQGQTASTRLDSVIRYVMKTQYLDRDTILLLAGINPTPGRHEESAKEESTER